MTGYPGFVLIFILVVGLLLLGWFVLDAFTDWRAKADPRAALRQYEYELRKRAYEEAFRAKYGVDPIWGDILLGGVLIGGLFAVSSLLYFLLRPKRRRPVPGPPYRR